MRIKFKSAVAAKLALFLFASVWAPRAYAILNGEGQDIFPVPAVFQSSATISYISGVDAGITVSSGLVVSTGSVGIGTALPQARLDVLAAGVSPAHMAQIWRDGNGDIVSSMSATGVQKANYFEGNGSRLTGIAGTDNLGNHVATTTLQMGIFGIVGTGSLTMSTLTVTGSSGVYGMTVSSNVSLAGTLYTKDGHVGVGTNSPATDFAVRTARNSTGNVYASSVSVMNASYGDTYGQYISADSVGSSGLGDVYGVYAVVRAQGDNGAGYAGYFTSNAGAFNTASYGVYATNVETGVYGNGIMTGVEAYNDSSAGKALKSSQADAAGYSVYAEGGRNYFQNNVGIGSLTPNQKLTVAGNISQTGMIISSGTGNNYFAGNVGISTNAPQARLDVKAAGTAASDMAQIWRDGNGNIVSSMSATGVQKANYFEGNGSRLTGIAGDNLGNHIATTELDMAGFGIKNSGAITASSVTITGNAFSVGGSTFTVKAGRIGIGTEEPKGTLELANQLVFGPDPIDGNFADIWPGNLSPAGSNFAWQVKNDGTQIWFNAASGGYTYFTINNNTSAGNLLLKGSNVGVGYGSNDTVPSLFAVKGGAYFDGDVGFHTNTPQARLDVTSSASTPDTMAQIWRDGSGAIVSSMSALGGLKVAGSMDAAEYQVAGVPMIKKLEGTGSTALGLKAGAASIAEYNLFVGYNAGLGSVFGGHNTVVGALAGYKNSAGFSNTIVGYMAANNPTSGQYNTIVGAEAGGNYFDASYSSTTLVGYQAGYSLNSGAGNIFIGWRAGNSVINGGGNIVIGMDQDVSATTASNELNIGGVLFGKLDSKYIGVNIRAPKAALDVTAADTTDGPMGQVWRNTSGVVVGSMSAEGVMTAVRFVGDGTGLTLGAVGGGDGLGNHVATTTLQMGEFGINSSSAISAAEYQMYGVPVLAGAPGRYSFSVGQGFNAADVGTYNMFAGINSGAANTSGMNNSFFGDSSGYLNQTGSINTYIGFNAGSSDTSGASNTYVGGQAGASATGSANTYLGASAGIYNSGGSSNVAIGFSAGAGSEGGTTYSNSTLIGFSAGSALTTGTDNILIGYQAGATLDAGSYNIIIGNSKSAPAPGVSSYLNIGDLVVGDMAASSVTIRGSLAMTDAAVSGNSELYTLTVSSNANLTGALYTKDGHVGINTSHPKYPLDVYVGSEDIRIYGDGPGGLGFVLEDTDTGGHAWYFNTNPTDGGFGINHAGSTGALGLPGTRALTILPDMNVGINVAAPGQKLEINGGMRLNTSDGQPACDSAARGTFWVVQGASLVKDQVQVCAKDAADAYAWRTIY